MNKDKILKAAFCVWDDDGYYVVRSSLLPTLIGAGAATEEAWQEYLANLDQALQQELTENSGPELKVIVNHGTSEQLQRLASLLGCTVGQAIDYAVAIYSVAELPAGPKRTGVQPVPASVTT